MAGGTINQTVRPLLTPLYDGSEAVSYTGTAGTSAALPGNCTAVMVWATTDTYIKVGASVTATSNDLMLPAYTPIIIPCEPADVVSFLRIATSGTGYVNPFQ